MAKLKINVMDNDGADLAMGTAFHRLKNFIYEDMEVRIASKNPEPGLLALMRVIKVLIEQFETFRGGIQRSEFKRMKDLFYEWHDAIEGETTKKYHKGILELAEEEFEAFRKMRWPDE